MPREHRKRGKKHKKNTEEEFVPLPKEEEAAYEEDQAHAAGPSWIVPAQDESAFDPNAPFGYVDSEVKAYFRTVDVQICDWQDTRPEVDEDEDVDPNEDRRLFFVAALQEMSGKEKQLATDPDCSTILERMTYSMDDFVRRVFLDRLTGSFEQLSKHRFASHVCQTLFSVASETVSRESHAIFPTPLESEEDNGELRTCIQLILDACEELTPSLSSLIMDPFASHVVRALLILLAPDVFSTEDAQSGTGKSGIALRSKKSAAYKARQGSMKSVFTADQAPSKPAKSVPKEFRKAATRILTSLSDQLGENEVRALGANQVASPVLQMLLELEAAFNLCDAPGSLMDHALVGLITAIHEDSEAEVSESDYLTTLLRDPTASHLLEVLVRRSPGRVFDILWQIYFVGKLSKLAVHPVANFVVSKAIEKLNEQQLAAAVQELGGAAAKIVKNARIGVLSAFVDRASVLQSDAKGIVELILTGFELKIDETRSLDVPCILRLKTPNDYQQALASSAKAQKSIQDGSGDGNRHKRPKTDDPLEPKTQGALLLQALLRLPAPLNDVVLDSLYAMSVEQLIEMAHHPTSSRVLDAVLESPTIPFKSKRKFVMTFIGHYHLLVDDRIGSRVGDRCWAAADPYLKEKIARSVIQHEHALAGSSFGKYFARNLNLHILQRDPERWKGMQAAAKPSTNPTSAPALATPAQVNSASTLPAQPTDASPKIEKGKRKARPQDEIDALFDATLGKKVKKAELAGAEDGKEETNATHSKVHSDDVKSKGDKKSRKRKDREEGGESKDLEDVLGAIRSAPKDKGAKKKKRVH